MTSNETGRPSPHPLVESIGRAADLNDRFTIPIRDLGQAQSRDEGRDGWIEAESLFQSEDERLRDLVISYGRNQWNTENRHVAGSSFIVAYLTRLTYPLISQYVLENRILDVSLSNLAFSTNGERINGTALNRPRFAALPDDRASGHPDAQIVPDQAALYGRLKDRLFDSNFELVVPSLHRAARASLKVSLNAVASSCAQVFHRLYESTAEPEIIMRRAEDFFGDPSSPVYRQVSMEVIEHRGKWGYFPRRAGCCLWWRVRESKEHCSGCILLSREEQDLEFRKTLEDQA